MWRCPQDEFLRSDPINAALTELGVQHVFSVAPASEWPKIYDGLDRERVGLSRVLTGYLDEQTLARTQRILGEGRERTIDIGYRTVPGKPYLGRHAILKAEIAEVIRERAEARGLRVDISTRAEDTFYGDDWYRFLASCRYTIGMEGGASILDRDGSVRACVESRLEEKPAAGFPSWRQPASPAGTASSRCYASPPAIWRRARRAPRRSSSRASTAGCCDRASTTRPAPRPVEPRRGAGPGRGRLDAEDEIADSATRRRRVRPVDIPAARRGRRGRAAGSPPPGAAADRQGVRAVDTVSRPLIPLATRT